MVLLIVFTVISIIMLFVAYMISSTRKKEDEVTVSEFVSQLERDKALITIFTLLTFNGGQMIFSPSKKDYLGTAIFMNIMMFVVGGLVLFIVSNSIGLTKSGDNIVILTFILIVVIYRFSTLIKTHNTIEEYKIRSEKELRTIEENRQKKQHESYLRKIEEEKKYTSEKFITSFQKAFNLFKNNILSLEEYHNRVDVLFADLLNHGIIGDPDDFLADIIILKEKEIINQDLLIKISKIIKADVNTIDSGVGDKTSGGMGEISKSALLFIESVTKAYKLKESGVYTNEEFTKRKHEIIQNLKIFKDQVDIDAFLSNILPLCESGALNTHDVEMIKSIL